MTKDQMNNLAFSVLSNTSRYYNDVDVVEYNGSFLYNKPIKKFYPKNSQDKYIVLDDNKIRIDSIAKKEYKNPKYWWVIAQANNISNPMKLRIGQTLKIPSISN